MSSSPRAALLAALLIASFTPAYGQTWGERLGYPKGRKVLILHADDVGMCFEANQAAKAYLSEGQIQSAALMVPCPWFDEAAAWYREHPQHDIGLHLTLTSEWKRYRWGPVSPRASVPGLLDEAGYFHKEVPFVVLRASAEEVEREIRAQVQRALAVGIRPSHLDTHMGALYGRPDFAKAYTKVAVEYGIPAMVIEMTPKRLQQFRAQGYPLTPSLLKVVEDYPLPKLDDFRSVPKASSYEDLKVQFAKLLSDLDPGITEIIFHPSVESPALRRITNSWQQRVWEARMFADPAFRELLEAEGVVFTNWREMMRRWKERAAPPHAHPAPRTPRDVGKRFF